ncbi:hypothetical protein PBAL39_07615 [Pedobacter sp. BAL39]|uniref:RagB/SusD family nutrient uptake outer membrane protein n=1 Tax=Pedobacter sp. BAL39 TaxID=391596 RepID=UPI0001559E64|nr:RagB/SusD family nutrient uptake outer membrane protein [Pedobacter sp. BAL39]EDM35537.1 hypothetical protein PBAL39_07615 [Pedobacter sp. BAL39]
MTIKTHFIALLSTLLLMTGCTKYLDVQPEGAYTEDQVFKNESAVQQALNGLYIDLADNSLYGSALSNTNIEVLGQRYMTPFSGSLSFSYLQQYQYQQGSVQTEMDNLWKKAYTTILSANLFLSRIDGAINGRVLTAANGNILKGEALAIRALLHFDLLRLFGPAHTEGAQTPAIPYYTLADGTSQPVLNSSQVLEKVIADLNAAAALLANDPITQAGLQNNANFYGGYRNQRLNFYAVKALTARVYLWAGRSQEANAAAKAVLDAGERWFPWMPYSDIVSNANPDRIFSPEVLFAVYNPQMYTNYTASFSPDVTELVILRPDPDRLSDIFEGNENDYRYTTTWLTTIQNYPTFFKFADPADKTKTWRFLQPMLRKSEMYYILAETAANPQTGIGYLNQVRHNRGLADLQPTADLAAELRKEYQKEFWGEGQLFFYYKRKREGSVPSGMDVYSTVSPSYIVPLPLSETTPR